MPVVRKADVAVIGAGPAGLAVAHELLKEGHNVTVFEASSAVGGAWCFDSSTDSDLLGLDPARHRVHSSMYHGLRANLPRPLMTFLDFPFLPSAMKGKSHDPRMYPLHSEILAYYEAFAEHFNLCQHIMFNTKVVKIDPVQTTSSTPNGRQSSATEPCPHVGCDTSPRPMVGHLDSSDTILQLSCAAAHNQLDSQHDDQQQVGFRWRVMTQSSNEQAQEQQQQQQEWSFDAVASCVGIFSEPNLPQVPGMSSWPGLQLHCHNYRDPKMFSGKTVVVVGASFSGEEIARHIAHEAVHVYQSARTFTGPGTAREPVSPPAAAAAVAPDNKPVLDCNSTQSSAGLSNCQLPHHMDEPQAPPLPPASSLSSAAAGLHFLAQQEQQQQDIPAANEPRPNMTRVPMIQQLLPDGSVVLQGHQVLQGVDAVVYSTGYQHSYPWLQHLDIVKFDDMHVRPLYLHMFPPAYAPSFCFIGLPWRCAKIPQFQLQGQLFARLLAGRVQLPPVRRMQQEQEHMLATMLKAGIPRRYTHCMATSMPMDEWRYASILAELAQNESLKDGDTQVLHHDQQQPGTPYTEGGQCRVHFEAHKQPHQESASAQADEGCRSEPMHKADIQHQQKGLKLQQQDVLVMPEWLQQLGRQLTGSILGRPDTFRDLWTPEIEELLQHAQWQMNDSVNQGPCSFVIAQGVLCCP